MGKIPEQWTAHMRSPFRYPGGKSWFLPYARKWFALNQKSVDTIVEPFAGGGIVTLTAVIEDYVQNGIMIELDADIASVWEVILDDEQARSLMNCIADFNFTTDNAINIIEGTDNDRLARAFRTIIKNRTSRAGILAPGAGRIKNGERSKGLSSRWYADTLVKRIECIYEKRGRISFIHGDAFEALANKTLDKPSSKFFIDPPYYTAGKRLYTHNIIDHSKLFAAVKPLEANFLMTYDDNEDIISLAAQHNMPHEYVTMKNSHHQPKKELIISSNFDWLN